MKKHNQGLLVLTDVKADGEEVSSEGTVDSLYQKELAEKITWKGPGCKM